METITNTSTGLKLKVDVAVDMKTAAILAIALFVAITAALIVYKNS